MGEEQRPSGILAPAASSEMKEERLLPQLERRAPTPGMIADMPSKQRQAQF